MKDATLTLQARKRNSGSKKRPAEIRRSQQKSVTPLPATPAPKIRDPRHPKSMISRIQYP